MIASRLLRSLCYQADELENDIGINSCCHIIQNDPKASTESFLQSSDGRGFDNIKKPEKKEADDDKKRCLWNPQHRDEKSHHLIDHDSGIIFFPKKYFSIFRNPNGEKEKSNESDFIDWRWNGREKIINRDGDEGPHRPWSDGGVTDTKSGCEKEEETIHKVRSWELGVRSFAPN